MAARDRYDKKVACTGCGSVTVFHVSEEDHPYITSLGRRIEGQEGDSIRATVTDNGNRTTYRAPAGRAGPSSEPAHGARQPTIARATHQRF